MKTRIKPLFKILLIGISMTGLIGCAGTAPKHATPEHNCTHRITHENLNAVTWMQTSGEFPALSHQAFNLARLALDKALADNSITAAVEQSGDYQTLPPAIITDADETIIDNSPFQAWVTKENLDYGKETWARWTSKAEAEAIPGSVEFLQYAASRGVTVFYVTNRDSLSEADTKANLVKCGFPMNEGVDNLLVAGENGWKSEKASRRAWVAKNYRIVMLMGDDLGDFIPSVRDSLDTGRKSAALKYADKWGSQWIVIPNPSYGGWESAFWKGLNKPTDADKLKVKYNKLRLMK